MKFWDVACTGLKLERNASVHTLSSHFKSDAALQVHV
eukprot:CAMPEP_0182475122 /NCGR_PEP_ID=MMETSP1319-20130603/26857_1 /TAXON_ID=172717 /ORGANISM="Bolidomonas pacifica, Strain RCC208" /LENGTH=36 /DNA_ID= /DNA_START= /DNA_END= /DNA_ORIENTATION=